MASTAELSKTYIDFAKNLTGPKSFYLVAGAGDLAVEKARGLRVDLVGDPAKVTKLPRQVADRIVELPAHARKLGDKLTDYAGEQVKAADARYGELAKRGEAVVARVRSPKSTKDLLEQAKATVTKARGVRGAAERGTKTATATATTAAKSTANTARRTASRSKAAATSKAAAANSAPTAEAAE